jgi:hypothetical protein
MPCCGMTSLNMHNVRVRVEIVPEFSDDVEQRYLIDLRYATVRWDVEESQWTTLTVEGAPRSLFPREGS